jgi:hypothetical protein
VTPEEQDEVSRYLRRETARARRLQPGERHRQHRWSRIHATRRGPFVMCQRCWCRVRWVCGPRGGTIREVAPKNQSGYRRAPSTVREVSAPPLPSGPWVTVLYNVQERRPACVLLQAAAGGSWTLVNKLWPAALWLEDGRGCRPLQGTDAEWEKVAAYDVKHAKRLKRCPPARRRGAKRPKGTSGRSRRPS